MNLDDAQSSEAATTLCLYPSDATSIHWHGVRLPAAMDGTMAMQNPIPPGGTFRYEFAFKDAGLYWYHPHVRTDMQVSKGLYGAIRVRGPDEPVVDDERILISTT